MHIHTETTDLSNNIKFDYYVSEEAEAAELIEQLKRENLKVTIT